ncbi:MAG TPA: hypothetical protein VGF16_03120 [Bryobacteraceae bacterium]
MGAMFCLPFAWWFVTGMFMMYWDYPEVREADRLERAQALDGSRVRVAPQEALTRLNAGQVPRSVQLQMFDGRPVYRFGFGYGDQRLVHADDGTEIAEFPPELLRRVAAQWTGRPATMARFEGVLTSEDQWTVAGSFRALRPLRKYSWPDGQEVYVSEATGAVEQYTTRSMRVGAYFGAIPHWLYFTPLRKNGRLWSRVVITASALSTVAAVFGVIAGIWMYMPGRGVPYKGWKRLHMILGLLFGVIACTWAFSGMLSMEPFPIEGRSGENAGRIAAALRGKRPALEAFDAKQPRQALAEASEVKELEFTSFAGEPVYLAKRGALRSRVIPVRGAASDEFDWREIARVAEKAAPLVEARPMSEYDAYYLNRRHERPLPVVLLRLGDADNTRYYIDTHTARIVGGYASDGWMSRWLYHGLHSINLPWLYRNRPAWDILVLALLAGGATLSATAIILAWQLLRRKLI